MKLSVIPTQYYDLIECFKEFCDTNYIDLVGYTKDIWEYQRNCNSALG